MEERRILRKVDVFNHIFPRRFFDRMMEEGGGRDMGKRVRSIPVLWDLDRRFRVLEEFGDEYQQVLSLAAPPIEVIAGPKLAVELARLANDGMAELVDRYPERFPAFVASLPLNDVDATLEEMARAIDTLGARGIQVFTNVNGRPLDEPELWPIFERMAAYDLPIWIHPARGADVPDYRSEPRSRYEIWWTLGWPYETSAAMARLVFSGTLDRLPSLKVITHHLGGLVPYLEGRVGPGWDQIGARTSDEDYVSLKNGLRKRPYDYFKEDFLADTAVFGARAATVCGLEFFGADRVLFASDSPFDPEGGSMYIRETIAIIDSLDIPEEERAKIYHRNAERLLKL
jgi:predicted TIM-barrel fold metal-dependent hydrolase